VSRAGLGSPAHGVSDRRAGDPWRRLDDARREFPRAGLSLRPQGL